MSVKNSKTGAGQTELFPRVLGEKQVMEAKQKSDTVKELDDATRKMLRREEDVQKKMLIEREEENFTNLFALKCSNGWLKIYDNSAMILSSWLDGRLGRPYHRADDNGFGVRAKYGVVSIPPDKVQELIQALDQANVKLSFDDEWVLEFQLGERISQEDMVRMLHEDELIINKTNKLVMPKETMPNLRSAVKSLLVFVHSIVRHQSESVKMTFLNEVEKMAVDMDRLIVATSRGTIKPDKCLKEVGQITEELYESSVVMSDLKLLTAKQYKDFVDHIKRVESEQGRTIRRDALMEADAKIEEAKKRDTDD